jgi:hypothetical protein
MLDMNTPSKSPVILPNGHVSPPKYLYPMDDADCSYEYTNLLVNIGNQFEYVDSETHQIGNGAYGRVYKVTIASGKVMHLNFRARLLT